MKSLINYFSLSEKIIWSISSIVVILPFVIFGGGSLLSLITSLIGVTSLIFAAKGDPIGPFLMVIFGILYAVISLNCSYYGEMITYLGMTAPMSAFSLISWLRNPSGNGRTVKVGRITSKEAALIPVLTIAVTVVFYFVLRYFNTAQLPVSTFSVATSFLAVYLTMRRSKYYALAYALNDIVLMILWGIASIDDRSYAPVFTCFSAFLVNDIYGFISWQKMENLQKKDSESV